MIGKFSAGRIVNGAAWVAIGALILVAALIAARLAFAGLFILGVATWFICTMAALDQKAPTWGEAAFRASLEQPRSPEEREAAYAEQQTTMSPLRFYGRCGAFLAAVGAAGFAWQLWM